MTGGWDNEHFVDEAHHSQTQVLNTETGSWTLRAPFSEARGDHGCAFTEDFSFMYIIGGRYAIYPGNDDRLVHSVEKFDVAENYWTTIDSRIYYTSTQTPQPLTCVVDNIQAGLAIFLFM